VLTGEAHELGRVDHLRRVIAARGEEELVQSAGGEDEDPAAPSIVELRAAVRDIFGM
jgi:hypothetical protein